jgi:hypothetical protein
MLVRVFTILQACLTSCDVANFYVPSFSNRKLLFGISINVCSKEIFVFSKNSPLNYFGPLVQ